MIGMSLSTGISTRGNRTGVVQGRLSSVRGVRRRGSRETRDEHVEHDTDDDLLDEVLDRERGQHAGHQHATHHRADQTDERVSGDAREQAARMRRAGADPRSIATFTTPARSPMTPPRAPNTSGTDSDTAPNSRLVTGTSPRPMPDEEREDGEHPVGHGPATARACGRSMPGGRHRRSGPPGCRTRPRRSRRSAMPRRAARGPRTGREAERAGARARHREEQQRQQRGRCGEDDRRFERAAP